MIRRYALLIGYSGWDEIGEKPLEGVSKDLLNYKQYLMSDKGGAWFNNEIKTLEDTTLKTVLGTIEEIRKSKFDVVFVVFSGHGECDPITGIRKLWITSKDSISEHDLDCNANKQIIIMDSCSGYRETLTTANESRILLESKLDSQVSKLARLRYEIDCVSCEDQELRYYASSKGKFAYDTADGGLYSSMLLQTLKNSENSMNINEAHSIASVLVENRSNGKQKPDSLAPRLHQYLPGSICTLNM